MKKCVYGLTDASLYWYNMVKDTMQQLGATVSKVDPAVFYWLDHSCNVMGVLAAHLVDFIWVGSHAFSTAVIPQLKDAFQVGREEHHSFSYIGMQVNSLKDEIQVQQSTCIKSLHLIPVDPTRAIEFDMFKATIGPIVSVARQSRPDIMCDISILATQTQSMLLSRPCTVQTNSSEN